LHKPVAEIADAVKVDDRMMDIVRFVWHLNIVDAIMGKKLRSLDVEEFRSLEER
jgi:hypothetical protein